MAKLKLFATLLVENLRGEARGRVSRTIAWPKKGQPIGKTRHSLGVGEVVET